MMRKVVARMKPDKLLLVLEPIAWTDFNNRHLGKEIHFHFLEGG